MLLSIPAFANADFPIAVTGRFMIVDGTIKLEKAGRFLHLVIVILLPSLLQYKPEGVPPEVGVDADNELGNQAWIEKQSDYERHYCSISRFFHRGLPYPRFPL
jgi:hypothetical protein